MPSLAQFRTFLAIYETGGIRAAAERIGRTPSAISTTLKRIEDEVGAPLFEPGGKNRLSNVGAFVLQQARSLLEHSDRAHQNIRAFAVGGGGAVDVAALPSVAVSFMPAALKAFSTENPDVVVQLRDLDSNAINEAVARERVDWGVATYRQSVELEAQPLFSEPLNLVVSSNDPLVRRRGPIPWRAIQDRQFLANGAYEGLNSEDFLALASRCRTTVRNVLSLLSMVRAGAGVTVLPSLLRSHSSEGVRFLAIDDPAARRTAYFLKRPDRELTPAAARLLAVLRVEIARDAKAYGLELPAASADRPGGA